MDVSVVVMVALLLMAVWLTRAGALDAFETKVDPGCSPSHPQKGSRVDTRGMCCLNKWSNRSGCVIPQ
jgi:hypothetical protein